MLVSVVGTRPQIIKAGLLSSKLDMDVIDTGQHYDHEMAGQYYAEFNIEPIKLEGGGDVASMYKNLLPVLYEYDTVIVYGDCNTTLAGALAANKLGKMLVHVEAGCRSFNRRMVEESIRITVDHMADLNLCPSTSAMQNLNDELIASYFTGDLSQDYINRFMLSQEPGFPVITIHRAENLEHMDAILDILSELPGTHIWPQHPKMKRYKLPHNIKAIEPVEYDEMLGMVAAAPYIITDSGGLQKEAYMLMTPCITLREDTEWPETLHDGWNTLTGIDKDKVLDAIEIQPSNYKAGLFGDGDAAERIANVIASIDRTSGR